MEAKPDYVSKVSLQVFFYCLQCHKIDSEHDERIMNSDVDQW